MPSRAHDARLHSSNAGQPPTPFSVTDPIGLIWSPAVRRSFQAQDRPDRGGARRSRSDRLRSQLNQLYGPLDFYAGQNEELIRASAHLQELYRDAYEGKDLSAIAVESITSEVKDAIAKMNDYAAEIVRNNESIAEVLRANYGHADPEDTEAFQQLLAHMARLRVEQSAEPKLPLRLAIKADSIHFYDAAFVERIKHRFAEKSAALIQL